MALIRQGQNRQWSDEQMYQMMDKINRGFTYQNVTDGTHVPISTLCTRYSMSTCKHLHFQHPLGSRLSHSHKVSWPNIKL